MMSINGSARFRAVRSRTWSGVALAAAAAVAVSACGSSSGGGSKTSGGSGGGSDNGVSSKSADDILTTAINAAKQAKSVHVSGAVNDGGEKIGIDLSIASGKGAAGTISEGDASFKLIEAGDAFYIQPNKAFLLKFAHSAAAEQLFKGKWLKGSPTNSSFQSFGELTSIDTLMGSLTKDHGTLSKGSSSTVGGQKAIALNSSKGGTMYVATTGQPYPLQVSKTSGSQTGKVTFSQYNQAFQIKAPGNSIDLDKLQSGG
jgi:hypothetical protein